MRKTEWLVFTIFFIYPLILSAQQDSCKVSLEEIKPLIYQQADTTKVPPFREWQGTFNELSLVAGYTINRRSEKSGIDNHIFELGLYKSRNSYYTESAGYSYYFSNEFMFNKKSFYLGPKIGTFFHLWMFYLGSELVYYTNFKGQALHIVPIFGLGHSNLKIGFGLHIPVTNNLFEKTNVVSFGFTYQIKSLKKEKINFL